MIMRTTCYLYIFKQKEHQRFARSDSDSNSNSNSGSNSNEVSFISVLLKLIQTWTSLFFSEIPQKIIFCMFDDTVFEFFQGDHHCVYHDCTGCNDCCTRPGPAHCYPSPTSWKYKIKYKMQNNIWNVTIIHSVTWNKILNVFWHYTISYQFVMFLLRMIGLSPDPPNMYNSTFHCLQYPVNKIQKFELYWLGFVFCKKKKNNLSWYQSQILKSTRKGKKEKDDIIYSSTLCHKYLFTVRHFQQGMLTCYLC